MPNVEEKSKSTEEVKATPTLKVFNFTRDGIVVKAENRKEAEKLLESKLNTKEKK